MKLHKIIAYLCHIILLNDQLFRKHDLNLTVLTQQVSKKDVNIDPALEMLQKIVSIIKTFLT